MGATLKGLATIQRFDLLRQLFGKIHIAQAVYDEAVTHGREEGGAKQEVSTADWISTHHAQNHSNVNLFLNELDLGEAETIALAQELNASWVLMDERKGRKKLSQLGLPKIGTLGILLKSKQTGLLPVIRPDIEKLCQQGFSISQTVIDAVLHQAGE
ncbi:DUF3368 domain-containing protein [Anaerolineales bacterium HSG25]|nr:DUF3368 domain-containing protein [Anaerolineales bacterium HSG25]